MWLKNPWKFHCNPFTGAVDMWCQVPFHNKYNSSSSFENPKIKRVQNGVSCKRIHSLVLRVSNMGCLLHIAEIPVVRSTIKYEYPIPWMGPNNCWKVSEFTLFKKLFIPIKSRVKQMSSGGGNLGVRVKTYIFSGSHEKHF
jgi:hypothetical protein